MLGEVDAKEYPLPNKQHTMEYLREIAHLRPRTHFFGCVVKHIFFDPSQLIRPLLTFGYAIKALFFDPSKLVRLLLKFGDVVQHQFLKPLSTDSLTLHLWRYLQTSIVLTPLS